MLKNLCILVLGALFFLLPPNQLNADNPFSTHFAFHFGLTSGGLKPVTSPENPMVFSSMKDQLQVGWGRNLGLSIEQLKWKNDRGETRPSWGFRLGLMFNNIDQEYEKSILEGYHFKYLRIPFDILYCIYSKKAYIRDDDEVIISGDRITFHRGAGVIATRTSVFIHAGLSYGKLNAVSYQANTSFGPQYVDSFNRIKSNISSKDPAFQIGLEFRHANGGLQVYYQESTRSIYKGAEIKNGMFGVLLKLII